MAGLCGSGIAVHPKITERTTLEARSTDLRIYVAAELQRRMDKGTLKLRDLSLKEYITARIVSKANGM